ncbi:MAG: DEAD/DEAH box helicase family protein [bacterium]
MTGKTYTSLEVYRRVKPKSCLIITTARLINEEQWHEEIVEYLGYIPENITLISHQMISRRYKEYIKKKYDMIIFDEAHKIKANAKQYGGTKISRLIMILSKRAEYVVPMTGTPVADDFIDIFNIFRNSDIKMWYGWKEHEFIETYYHYMKRDFMGAGFKQTVPIALKQQYKETLWNLIRKKAIVVKTDDVVDLKKQFIKVFYVDGMQDTEMYKLIDNKILKYKNYEDTLITLKKRNFQRQAANGFIYEETDDKEPLEFSDKKVNEFGRKTIDILKKLDKLVVIYWFKHDKKRLMEKLDEIGILHTTSKKEFAKKSQVFFLHFSDSEGLNLQNISHGMLFYSYEQSYMNFNQICGRIRRRGQKEACYYFIMISRGTIEESIWNGIKNKKERDDFVKNDYRGD